MNNRAFTLIELIIVIAIIAILAALSFVAVNPAKRIGQAQDDERLTEARSIEEAIEKYTVDKRVLPNSISSANDGLYMITITSLSGQVSCGGLDIDELNISTELNDYLPSLPLDPNITDESTEGTGYFLVKNENLIQVGSCDKYDANSFNFICGGPLTDTRDGQGYNTVQIGSQCWMKQGLNIGTRIDSSIPQSEEVVEIEKYCYNDDEDNCSLNNNPNYPDGGLYELDELMAYTEIEGTQGICPDNWHIPSDDEYKKLEIYLGMNSYAADDLNWRGTNQGDQLKPFDDCTNGVNCGSSGFEGNLAGELSWSNVFQHRSEMAYFYSSTLYVGITSKYRKLHWNMPYIWRGSADSSAYSVRCLKD